jgi:acetolactate synthase-1/3 small subunit
MRHTLSIVVENRFGELSRIVGLFSARGYNIESLTVAETLDPDVSHITLVTSGNDHVVEQILKQVDKQVRVLGVLDVTDVTHVKREMALIKVEVESAAALAGVVNLVMTHDLKLVDLSECGAIIEATGDWEQVSEIIRLLKEFGVREVSRSGAVAITGLSSENDATASRQEELSFV